MANPVCQCCGQRRPVVATIRRNPLRWTTSWQADPELRVRRHDLCGPCERWLRGLIDDVRNHTANRSAPLLGAPSSGGRQAIFEDQCRLCLSVPYGRGTMIDCILSFGAPAWPPFFVCPSCDAWIASLAEDGRSARGEAARAIDGPYGEWPHPNLRELSVALQLADTAARDGIVESCKTMGIEVARGSLEPGCVLFLEVTPGASVATVIREHTKSARAIIVVAPLAAERELRESLRAGASNWLTLPLTPQQVTAGLAAALRHGGRLRWDEVSCLPVASLEGNERPAIAFVPQGETDAFSVAWMLRRFARGYDDVVSAAGQVVLLPRAPLEQLEAVRVRLDLLFAGRARSVLLDPAGHPPARLDISA